MILRRSVLTLFIISLLIICQAQKFNLDFEQQSISTELPDGWFKWGDYLLSADTAANSGKLCGKITSNDKSFGSIAYRIPAVYSGNEISLEGYMRTENVTDGFAGLLLRVDKNGTSAAFDNMQGQNINGTKDWIKYAITLPFPKGADAIYVAGILTGKGSAWFDDFVVKIDGESLQTKEEVVIEKLPAQLDEQFDEGSMVVIPELTPQLTEELVLIGKIWGFLKYHHPVVARGQINWDYELFRFLPRYFEASSEQRPAVLVEWIDDLGEVPECSDCQPLAEDAFLKPDHSWMDVARIDQALRDRLLWIYDNRHQGEQFYVKPTPHVRNPDFSEENAYSKFSYPDEGFRLLAAYRYWNMIHYFFPYRHLIDRDWNEVLQQYIPEFVNAENRLEYELAALRMIGEIHDTHANLWRGGDRISEIRGAYFPPYHLEFVEGQLTVTDTYQPDLQEKAGVEIGDVVLKVNGRSVIDIVDSVRNDYPASNDAARMRSISKDIIRSTVRSVRLIVMNSSGLRQIEHALYSRDSLEMFRSFRVPEERSFRTLDSNIGYITLANITNEDVEQLKDELRGTRGIIIDIRNYPSTFVPFSLGSYFLQERKPFAKFTRGNINHPGEFTMGDAVYIDPSDKPYTGKLVVLVNELSQSQAEYTSMAFRAAGATIIGSTTAGADGNVSRIVLPGGLFTMISGIGVYYPDGTETQRIGIVPDIEVKPTIEGIRQGRDELLEAAIELILQE